MMSYSDNEPVEVQEHNAWSRKAEANGFYECSLERLGPTTFSGLLRSRFKLFLSALVFYTGLIAVAVWMISSNVHTKARLFGTRFLHG
jgi:hypothetical protein